MAEQVVPKKDQKLYSLEDIKKAKKETAEKLLSKIGVLRLKYSENQLSTQDILNYVAGAYQIDIKYNKINEKVPETEEIEKALK